MRLRDETSRHRFKQLRPCWSGVPTAGGAISDPSINRCAGVSASPSLESWLSGPRGREFIASSSRLLPEAPLRLGASFLLLVGLLEVATRTDEVRRIVAMDDLGNGAATTKPLKSQ
ncbi:hypothetical protein ACLKA7_012112 [Drosophila subpalustris]